MHFYSYKSKSPCDVYIDVGVNRESSCANQTGTNDVTDPENQSLSFVACRLLLYHGTLALSAWWRENLERGTYYVKWRRWSANEAA